VNDTNVNAIVTTLTKLAQPETSPKKLFAQVSEAHPKASKKDIIRAAFRALIDNAAEDPGKADRLHEMAIDHRAVIGQE
jgi:hypothetical protein